MTASPAFVEARGLVKRYGVLEAVRAVDLDIAVGEIVGIAGPNGSGKSTLARLLLGFARPHAGSVRIDGRSPEEFRVQDGIGYVPEDGERGWERATPRQLLMLRLGDPDVPSARAICDSIGATPLLDKRVGTLSKGQWRACLVAYAMVAAPRFIVLDEPDAGLDPAAMERLRTTTALLAGGGSSILLLSHHLDEMALGVHRLLFFSAGRIRRSIDPRGVGPTELRREYHSAVQAA